MSVLEEILVGKRNRVAALRRDWPWSRFESEPLFREPRRSLASALKRDGGEIRFLCEIKRASPSAGEIRPGADAARIAHAYAEAGASGISLVTEQEFFRGRPEDLPLVRAAGLPVLMKDFLVDPREIAVGKALGADSVLLIAAVGDLPLLKDLRAAARELEMEVLVEVHAEGEIDALLALDPEIAGVNHRDLRTFRVDPDLGERLLPLLPAGKARVAESGIRGREDARRLERVGFDACLVGEALMRAPDPGAALLDLRGVAAGGA